jgi:CDGSH-type Zn-finger protein
MARLVLKKDKGPAVVMTNGSPIHVCRCGLSKDKQGLCDGSHLNTIDEEEDKVYCYDKKMKREEVKEKGCCGGYLK